VTPSLQDGLYHSEVQGECGLEGVRGNQIPALARAIHSDLTTHRVVHSETRAVQRAGAEGALLDTTLSLRDEKLTLRESVFLATPQENRLIYETESKSIEGSGPAGYLKSLRFSAVVLPSVAENSPYAIRFTNAISVERPWFAIPFLFKSIAENAALEKFAVAQTRVMTLLTTELSKQAELKNPASTIHPN
jgi:hypothetical protein